MNRTIRLVKKTVVYLIGLFLLGAGIAGFYYAGWGSDPISVLYDGVHVVAHVSYGTASQIVSLTGVIFVLIFARKYFHVGTIISAVLLGPCINLATAIYQSFMPAPETLGIPVKILMTVISILLMGIGIAVCIAVNLGPTFADCLVLAIAEKTHKKYGIIRICSDALFTLAGFLMGGVVLYATLAAVVCSGPLIQFLTKPIQGFLEKGIKIDCSVMA